MAVIGSCCYYEHLSPRYIRPGHDAVLACLRRVDVAGSAETCTGGQGKGFNVCVSGRTFLLQLDYGCLISSLSAPAVKV